MTITSSENGLQVFVAIFVILVAIENLLFKISIA